jgi:hypothetical protein
VAHQFVIQFPELSAAEASIAASDLAAELNGLCQDLELRLVRLDDATQDLGTAIALVLGAPAAVIVARGVATFLSKRGTTASIETPRGRIRLTGDAVSARPLVEIVKALESTSAVAQSSLPAATDVTDGRQPR